jgi:uncharacterized protein
MAIPREYLTHLAAEMTKRLDKSGKVKVHDAAGVSGRIQQAFSDDASREDKLNQEVRDYLQQYNEQIRRDGISYQEMHQMVKRELMKKYKMVQSAGRGREGGKLSRDKVIELSHGIVNMLLEIPQQIEFVDEKNEVRLEIVRELQLLLKEEAAIDEGVRKKIQSQKADIAEGSAEWDILFRKYYSEEMRKLGVA